MSPDSCRHIRSALVRRRQRRYDPAVRATVLLSSLVLVGGPVLLEPLLSPTPFTIQVVDAETGEGVRGLRVTTDTGVICYTQAHGAVTWGEASVMGRSVRFDVRDETHRFDGTAAALPVTPGGRARIAIHRSAH
jgi:hypothetical protein